MTTVQVCKSLATGSCRPAVVAPRRPVKAEFES